MRAMLGEQAFPALFAAWLERLVTVHNRPRPKHATATGASAVAIAMSGSARGRVRYADLVKRVGQLEDELDRLWSSVEQQKADYVQQIAASERRLVARARELEESITALRDTVRALNVGSAGTELVGLGWIVVGQAATSFPSVLGL